MVFAVLSSYTGDHISCAQPVEGLEKQTLYSMCFPDDLQPQTILLGRSPSLRSPLPSFNVEVYLETSITAYCLS